MERAVHLLKTTDYTIERIATMVGYADGVTPCARCCGDGLDAACANCAPWHDSLLMLASVPDQLAEALAFLRQVAGGTPNSRLNARLNAASDS